MVMYQGESSSGLAVMLHVLFLQGLDQIRVVGRKSPKFLEVVVPAVDVVPLDGDFLHLPLLQSRQKVAEDDLVLGGPGLVEEVEEKDHHQADDQP